MTASTLIILLVAASFLLIAIRDRILALTVLTAVLPIYLLRFSIPLFVIDLSIPGTMLEIMILELFFVWLFLDRNRDHSPLKELKPWLLPLLLLIIGATIGVFVASDTRAALGIWRAFFIEPILLFFVFVDIVRTPKHRNMIVGALGFTVTIVGLSAIIQKMTGYGIPNPYWQQEATRRVTSFYGFPNAIGLFSAPIIILLTGRMISLFRSSYRYRSVWIMLSGTATVLGLLAIFFAVSEGAILATAAGLLILGLFLKDTRKYALISVIVACVVVIGYRPATNYASNIISLSDDSGSVRRIVWHESVMMLGDHPVFGAGLSGYPDRLLPYHEATHIEIFMYPHSILLNFWSETGIIGLTGLLWLLWVFFAQVIPLIRKDETWLPATLCAAMLAILIHGLVDVPFLKNDLAVLFLIIVGLVASLRTQNPSTRPLREEKPVLP